MNDGQLHQRVRSDPGHGPTRPERRRDTRYVTLFRVGLLETQLGAELCLIKNISSSGLRAQICSAPGIDGQAAVELKTGHKVAGRIVWADGEHVGVEFDHPIDVEDLLSNQAVGPRGLRSRLPRIDVRCFATLRSGARTYRGMSVDISQGGAKIELNHKLDQGQVVVSLPGMAPMHGLVRWSDERYAGVAFNELIPFHHLSRWMKESSQQERRFEGKMATGLAGIGMARHA